MSVFPAAAAAVWALVTTPSAQPQRPAPRREIVNGWEAAAGEVLVKYRGRPDARRRSDLADLLDADRVEEVTPAGLHRVQSRSLSTAALLASVQTHSDVEYAEPNYVYHLAFVPNDPMFGSLWGLRNTGQTVNGIAGSAGADIRATAAWDWSDNFYSPVVGILDTGIDYNHPDLAARVWSAPSSFTVSVGGRTIFCPAGSHGFNAIAGTCDPFDDHNDGNLHSHGTHVAGTIGATGNNGIGVAGVDWSGSRMMGLKIADWAGTIFTSDAVAAIEFAIQAKNAFAYSGAANVRVLSNSWSGPSFSQALLDQINRAYESDMLLVASAGNDWTNNDLFPRYPASYQAPNVIAVAATDSADYLVGNVSNFGPESVHLAAPGFNILSTTRNNAYGFRTGTSMAAPHVSGAASLLLRNCSFPTGAIKQLILGTADRLASLTGLLITGARLNLERAVLGCRSIRDFAPEVKKSDFDADRKADVAVWRRSTGQWFVRRSSTGAITSQSWGAGYAPYNDVPVPGDYDGDGRIDYAIWRPGTGVWHVLRSSNSSTFSLQWGAGYAPYDDVPVPGDYDADGTTDLAIWRRLTGTWHVRGSTGGYVISKQWGAGLPPHNDIPVPGDYDGDNRTDFAVWRPSTGVWHVVRSARDSIAAQPWGAGYSPYNDVPVPGDYDGDGLQDYAVWRPASGTWFVRRASNGATITRAWGAGYPPYNDVPVPADYDGDFKTDFAVWRPASGHWFIIQSSNGATVTQTWGTGASPYNDTPVPASGVR